MLSFSWTRQALLFTDKISSVFHGQGFLFSSRTRKVLFFADNAWLSASRSSSRQALFFTDNVCFSSSRIRRALYLLQGNGILLQTRQAFFFTDRVASLLHEQRWLSSLVKRRLSSSRTTQALFFELRSVKMIRPKMFRTSVPLTTEGASTCAATPLVPTTAPATRQPIKSAHTDDV